ncbi:unnamed protein product [Dracunculus medinensis]|uniref:Non-specific serine/threonine protein kinase n=1 Tax=Dracunculus medinensis TaxID=318479 RepID=A0A0N4U9D8_DRAME|nr:unnamed protein product [Dracunculus medinensis]
MKEEVEKKKDTLVYFSREITVLTVIAFVRSTDLHENLTEGRVSRENMGARGIDRCLTDLLIKTNELLENEYFLDYLLNDPPNFDWSLLMKFSTVTKEIGENRAMHANRIQRKIAFSAFKTLLSHQLTVHHIKGAFNSKDLSLSQANSLISILNLHTSYFASSDVGNDALELLLRILQTYTLVDVEVHHLRSNSIWDCASNIYGRTLDKGEQPIILLICAQIMLSAISLSYSTVFMHRCEKLIEEITTMIRKAISSFNKIANNGKLCGTLFTIASTVMEKFGTFSDLTNLLSVNISLIWKRHELMDVNESFFNLINNFIILCYPNCVISLCPVIIDSVLNAVIISVKDYIDQFRLPGKFIYRKIPVPKLNSSAYSLICRSITLIHLFDSLPFISAAKRCRTSSFLSSLIESNVEPAYKIAETIFNRWRQCFSIDYKQEILKILLELSVSIESEELFCCHMRTVLSIVDNDSENLLTKDLCNDLWKFSLSMLHFPRVSDAAARLISVIAVPCAKILSLNDLSLTESIVASVARLNSFSSDLVKLLAVIISNISNFDIDERSSFRLNAELMLWDVKWPKQWRFRCELLDFLISPNSIRSLCPEALLHILNYNPSYILSREEKSINELERSLMKLLVIEQKHVKECDQIQTAIGNSVFVVPEILNSLIKILKKLWSDVKDGGSKIREIIRLEIWVFLHLLCGAVRKYDPNSLSLNIIVEYLASLDDEIMLIIQSATEIVKVLELIEDWVFVSNSIRYAIYDKYTLLPELTRFVIHFDFDIDPTCLIDDLKKYRELLTKGSTLLLALRYDPVWMRDNEILQMTLREGIPEILSFVTYKLLEPPLLHDIHIRIFSYLIDLGSNSLYKDPPVTISMPSNAIVNGSGLLDTVSGAHDAPSPVIFDKELQLTISLPKSDLIGGDWNARADSRCRHLMVGKYGTAVRYDPICSSFCRA